MRDRLQTYLQIDSEGDMKTETETLSDVAASQGAPTATRSMDMQGPEPQSSWAVTSAQ